MVYNCKDCKIEVEYQSKDPNKCAHYWPEGGFYYCCNCAKTKGWNSYDEYGCQQCKARADTKTEKDTKEKGKEAEKGPPSSPIAASQVATNVKTQLCKFYKPGIPGSCRHGSKCRFAHGTLELKGADPLCVSEPARAKSSTSVKKESSESVGKTRVSSEGLELGSDEDNFMRFFRLCRHTGKEILLAVFKRKYREVEGNEWQPSCGAEFHKTIARETLNRLGKVASEKVKSGKCDDWDTTALSSLLLYSPGYFKNQGASAERSACEVIRDMRNQLSHNEDFKCKKCEGLCKCGQISPVLTRADFDVKWEKVSSAVSSLAAIFLSKDESQGFADSIAQIKIWKYSSSDVDEMRSEFNAGLKEVQDSVEQLGVKVESLIQDSLNFINPDGTIAKGRLPMTIKLSNSKSYEILEQTGSGGMGMVFIAVDQDTKVNVALKICNVGKQERADREAALMRKLTKIKNHDNVVKYIDHAIFSNRYIIIMELVKGDTLEEFLRQRYEDSSLGPVTWQESQDIILQMAAGMSEVHDLGITHRDLKPGNLMFEDVSNKVVIVDFGLSKQHHDGQTLTVAGAGGMGTVAYMSPEQTDNGETPISLPSDVWSMGIIWFEILCGITPFEPIKCDSGEWASASADKKSELRQKKSRKIEGQMINSINEKDTDWNRLPEGVPKNIKAVINKCLQKEPTDRYQNASEFLRSAKDAFQEAHAQLEISSSNTSSHDSQRAKEFAQWTVREVCNLLNKCGFSDVAQKALADGVDGKTWLDLDDEEMKELGMSRLKLKRFKTEMDVLDEL